jgi:c-di-GMP-binding flagellar brake protein YcgR
MTGTEEGRRVERRLAKRLDAAVPLTIRIVGAEQAGPPIAAETESISLKGLTIVIKIKAPLAQGRLAVNGQAGTDQYLFLANKRLQLEINVLPQGRGIPATGKVRWFKKDWKEGFYDVRAGVAIEEMEYRHKEAWAEFLTTIYRIQTSLGN